MNKQSDIDYMSEHNRFHLWVTFIFFLVATVAGIKTFLIVQEELGTALALLTPGITLFIAAFIFSLLRKAFLR